MEDRSKATITATQPKKLDAECQPVEKRLSDSLDVEITQEDIEELKDHLQGCPPCLEFVESLKSTVRLCKDFGIEQTPAPLAESTRSQMVEAYQRMLAKRERSKP